MADIIPLAVIRQALNAPLPPVASIVFDELAAASDLLDQGKDPIEVAKVTIKALQEIVDLSSQ